MDKIFILLASVFLLFQSNVFAEARVFLLAGQSNMSGAGLFDELTDEEKIPPLRVKIWSKGTWHDLGPGFSANKGRFGPELSFAREMRRAYPEDQIYLIKKAAGGTSLHKHWKAQERGGIMLKSFLSDADAALQDLTKRGENYSIDGMLWMQGEADAAQGMGKDYEIRLKALIKHLRSHFELPELPFIMGRILPTFDKPAGNGPMVRAAIEKIAKEDPYSASFDTDDFERINKGHYNHNGQITLGKTYAKHLLEMNGKGQSK